MRSCRGSVSSAPSSGGVGQYTPGFSIKRIIFSDPKEKESQFVLDSDTLSLLPLYPCSHPLGPCSICTSGKGGLFGGGGGAKGGFCSRLSLVWQWMWGPSAG